MSRLLKFVAFVSLGAMQQGAKGTPEPGWASEFIVDKADLVATGRNPYFILEPGYSLTLVNGRDQLLITVKERTRVIDGVTTRLVEEIETSGGRFVERSWNYFAISRKTSAIYYFGEDVDMYAKGRIIGHDGSWIAGVRGARFGMAMPGAPKVGDRYYQEIAPDLAMDRARILSVNDTVGTPSGKFTRVLLVEETSQIERGKEYKRYAPGVGLIQDGDLKLIGHR